MNLDSSSDALNVLRRAGSQKQKDVTYRNHRSYLMAEHVKFVPDNEVSNRSQSFSNRFFFLLRIVY